MHMGVGIFFRRVVAVGGFAHFDGRCPSLTYHALSGLF
jgi:hypothetical protein